MRCSTEIGRVDFLREVSVASSSQSSPREGNLHQVFQIFSFMINNLKLTIYFDLSFPNIHPTAFLGTSVEEFIEEKKDAM